MRTTPIRLSILIAASALLLPTLSSSQDVDPRLESLRDEVETRTTGSLSRVPS